MEWYVVYIGILFYSAFHYFQMVDTDVITMLKERVSNVSLSDYHAIFRCVITHYGNQYAVEVIDIMMVLSSLFI